MQTLTPAVARSIISPVVAVMFAVVAITGLLMLGPAHGGALRGLHEVAGIAMAIAGLAHLVVNWKPFLALFRHKRAIVGCALAAGLAVVLFFAGGNEAAHGRHHRTGSGLSMR